MTTVDAATIVEPTQVGIQSWCQHYIAQMLNMAPGKIDPAAEFDRFGLDSATAVSMLLELEEHLDVEVSPSLLFEYTTIADLSGHIAGRIATSKVEAA